MRKNKLKKMLVPALLLLALTAVTSCRDDKFDENEERFTHSHEGIPESKYLTTITESYLHKNIARQGWEVRDVYVINPRTGYMSPLTHPEAALYKDHNLYISDDSIYVFSRKDNKRVYTGKPYKYLQERNLIQSDALPYLQLDAIQNIDNFNAYGGFVSWWTRQKLTTVEYLFTNSEGKKVYGVVRYVSLMKEELDQMWYYSTKED